MLPSERSYTTLALALVAAGVLAAAFFAPWLSYDYSSGRRTAEGGFHDPADTRIERHNVDFYLTHTDGDVEPTDPATADRLSLAMAVASGVAVAGFVLMVLGELPWIGRRISRGVSLGACVVSFAGVAAALTIAWVWLPDTLSGYGIEGPFHYEQLDPGYIRTTIGLGWVVALGCIPFGLGALAFKYQAGSTDPSVIESVGRRAGALR